MPLDPWTLQWVVKPVTREEGLRILERDHFRCQYCGLDGTVSFENALAVDFVVTAGSRGPEESSQLGGLLSSVQHNKGARRIFGIFEKAKAYVLARREALRKAWEAKRQRVR